MNAKEIYHHQFTNAIKNLLLPDEAKKNIDDYVIKINTLFTEQINIMEQYPEITASGKITVPPDIFTELQKYYDADVLEKDNAIFFGINKFEKEIYTTMIINKED